MALPSHDVFSSTTECAPLVELLRAHIAGQGRITFRDFMDAALYHPEHGYYVTHKDPVTRGGDYVTSPERHAVFGSLVAKKIWQMWDAMGRPVQFDVVELGGGRGTLGRQIIKWGRREPAFAEALRYRILERTESGEVSGGARQSSSIENVDSLPHQIIGCVLSNEFFDALPVHRVKRAGDRILEVYVTLRDERFVETLDQPSTPEIEQYFERAGVAPGEGCCAEVNLAAERWTGDVGARLARGYVLTFDYGYEATQLYAPWRRDGTLRSFYRQSIGSDPYQRIGMQDMTSSINFTSLRTAGERAGLSTLGFTDQSRFLIRLGIGEGVAAVVRGGAADMEEYFARRNALLDLIDPAKLGRIKGLLQGRNVGESPLAGFSDDA